MSAKFTDQKHNLRVALPTGSQKEIYIDSSLTTTNSIQIFLETAVSASYKLQSSNFTREDAKVPTDDLDARLTGSQWNKYWYTEPSSSVPNSTGSVAGASGTHFLLHFGNDGARFHRLLIDNVTLAGTASFKFHGKE